MKIPTVLHVIQFISLSGFALIEMPGFIKAGDDDDTDYGFESSTNTESDTDSVIDYGYVSETDSIDSVESLRKYAEHLKFDDVSVGDTDDEN